MAEHSSTEVVGAASLRDGVAMCPGCGKFYYQFNIRTGRFECGRCGRKETDVEYAASVRGVKTTADDLLTERRVIRAAAEVINDAVLSLIQKDPHQWSSRPCSTCHAICVLVGKPFGCYVYAAERGAR